MQECPTPTDLGTFGFSLAFGAMSCVAIVALAVIVINRYHRSLVRAATRDHVTGAYNRQAFEAMAADAISSRTRSEQPLSVVLFDLDDFKHYNDTHGHNAGDAALREVARVATTVVRRSDVVSRWGGDEFVLLLPACDATAAARIAADLAAAVLSDDPGAAGMPAGISISTGVAELRQPTGWRTSWPARTTPCTATAAPPGGEPAGARAEHSAADWSAANAARVDRFSFAIRHSRASPRRSLSRSAASRVLSRWTAGRSSLLIAWSLSGATGLPAIAPEIAPSTASAAACTGSRSASVGGSPAGIGSARLVRSPCTAMPSAATCSAVRAPTSCAARIAHSGVPNGSSSGSGRARLDHPQDGTTAHELLVLRPVPALGTAER